MRSLLTRHGARFALAPLALATLVSACNSGPSDELSTEGRMHLVGQPLRLTSEGGGGDLSTQTFAAEGNFTYVASVDSPINPYTGTTVQATNFAFDERHAFVVYNTKDEEVSGALDVVDLVDPEKPVLVSSRLFTNAEFADIRLIGDYALAVGHRNDGAIGAALVVIDISNVADPRLVTTLDLPGHAATGISVEGITAYITTGDNGGLVTLDVSNPAAPVLKHFAELPNAVNVLRNYQRTYVLGGATGSVYTADDSGDLVPFADGISSSAFIAPSRMSIWNGQLYTNAGSGSLVRVALENGARTSLAGVPGTANGIDTGSGIAVLAQGERGTSVFDISRGDATQPLGSFAFPGENGSANQVRFGTVNQTAYIFLSNGLTGFRIIKTTLSSSDPSSCETPWWQESEKADWWSAPASAAGGTTFGSWNPAPESTDKCLVELFEPSLSNSNCSTTSLRRVRAIGPQPNEGQECTVSCPAGTVVADVHTLYGEASPLNAGGDYTCTGTTTPDLYEIPCDTMSNSCNGQESCLVRYHNEYCGDPWYYCIKNGRTKWACVPGAN